jgi:transketolase
MLFDPRLRSRSMAAVSQANLKLCGSHAGVSIGEDGPSQMALEDLAMMRAIEGTTVLYPSDAIATENAVRLAAGHRGIVYIRTSRPKTPVIYPADEQFEIGQAKVIKQSNNDKVAIVSSGVTLFEALAAYDQLKSEGISVRVIDLFSVKPVDEETLRKSGSETNNLMITVEDHAGWGGIGDAVASAVCDGIRVHQLAVRQVPRSASLKNCWLMESIDRLSLKKLIRDYRRTEKLRSCTGGPPWPPSADKREEAPRRPPHRTSTRKRSNRQFRQPRAER